MIGDAAQYGSQRFIPKVDVPVAPFAFQVDQRVLARTVLASAQDTTSVRGRATDEPEQVTNFTEVFESANEGPFEEGDDEPVLRTPTTIATLTIPRTSTAALQLRRRRRRSRILASLNKTSTVVSHGASLILALWSRSGTVNMKLV